MRSPTFGRNEGSTRAMALAPPRSKWMRVSEPSGSTSLMLTVAPPAVSVIAAKCSGRIPSTALPALRSKLAFSAPIGAALSSCAKTACSPRISTGKKFMAGEPMKPATNWLDGRSYTASGVSYCCTAVLQHHDAVGHGHGFDLLVGDEYHGGLQFLRQRFD